MRDSTQQLALRVTRKPFDPVTEHQAACSSASRRKARHDRVEYAWLRRRRLRRRRLRRRRLHGGLRVGLRPLAAPAEGHVVAAFEHSPTT